LDVEEYGATSVDLDATKAAPIPLLRRQGVFGALYGELTRRAGKNHDRLDYYLNVFSARWVLI
jgi:hypothetical protein